jgi:4-amino-4-deoxy-L-arabinose transferase-like glycosyltransferase
MKRITLLLAVIVLGSILRFYQLGSNPPSLSWDEASLGYNAYSILKSGKDEFGERYPLSRFIAFGDYKPPGYIYASVPSIWLLGLNEFSIRLPSVLAGIIMMVFTYLLTKELFGSSKISLLAAFIFSISPWSLQMSRAAYESNLAACFNLVGIYFFLRSRRFGWNILVTMLCFMLAFYTFNANRIIEPLLFIAFSGYYWRSTLSHWKWFIVAGVLGVLMLVPSISFLQSRESKLRFEEVTIFNNLDPVKLSNSRIAYDGNSFSANIMHNRRILFTIDFLKHYTDNFTGRFLFTHGDGNPRLSIQQLGELYMWELPFFVIGVLYLLLYKKFYAIPLLLWMLIAPIPAATARETPHALRILSILPTYQIFIAYGIYRITKVFNKDNAKLLSSSVVAVLLIMNTFYYLHTYYIHYPSDYSGEWQYGYREMVRYVAEHQNEYDQIFVTPALGRPYIYFAFYNQYSPDTFLKLKKADRDWYGFWTVTDIGNIHFSFDNLPKASGKILIVTTPGSMPEGGYREKVHINNLAGDSVFVLGDNL